MDFPRTCHPDTIAIYRYWQSKCAGRGMPARVDIDPIEIPAHRLPGVSVVDVVSDDRRYVYCLVSTGDVEIRGKDPTGQSVIEGYFGHSAEDPLSCYDKVVATCEPHLDSTPFIAATGRYVNEETIFLPLSDNGLTVNKILVFSYSRDVRGHAAGF